MRCKILFAWVFFVGFAVHINLCAEEVARVGSHTITVDEFRKMYRPRPGADIDSLKHAALDQLIGGKLMLIDAYEKGIEKEIKPEVEKFKNRLTVGKLYERAVVERAKVSPWELRDWWWKLGTEVKLSQMTVKDRSKLKAIYNDLRNHEDFGEVAEKHTKCKGCGKVRQVKWGELDPALEKAAFSLSPGKVSRPIRKGESWYILKVYERVKVKKPDFAGEKGKIESRLRGKKQSKLAQAYLDHLRGIAHPRYNSEVIEKLIKSPGDVEKDAVIMSWVGGEIKAGDFLKEAGRGLSMGRFDSADKVKSWISNKLTYEMLLPIEASRHGFDSLSEVKEQLKERKEMLLLREYRNREIDGKVLVTDEECKSYYKLHRDEYKADFEHIKSRVEWDLKREKKKKREEEVIKELRDRVEVEVFEENLEEI